KLEHQVLHRYLLSRRRSGDHVDPARRGSGRRSVFVVVRLFGPDNPPRTTAALPAALARAATHGIDRRRARRVDGRRRHPWSDAGTGHQVSSFFAPPKWSASGAFRRSMACECSCETRDSVSPSTAPTSFMVSSSW